MTLSGAQLAKALVLPPWRGLVVLLASTGAVVLAPTVRAQEPPPRPPPAVVAGGATGAAKPAVDLSRIRAQADAGNSEAEVAMGVAYRTGQGVEKDAKQARVWFGKAAAQKHPAGLRMLGDMYAHGEGGKKDTKKALENWQGAEAAGDAFAPILVADQLFADITGGGKPGSGKFKIAHGTSASRMDDIAAWYEQAEKRDPRPEVKQRAKVAIQVLAQIKAGLNASKHPG